MTQKYRTDDETRWGDGIGRNLEAVEVDINFWDIIERLVDLEDRPLPEAGIDEFSIVGNALYITLTDATIKGPYILPTPSFVARGAWAALTIYTIMDTFTANGKLYQVIFNHTSAATFDANANDGLGHDFYSLMLEAPSNVLPTGGAAGQVLTKATSDDFVVTWSWKLPTGGTAGQLLRKVSGTQDDAEWAEPDASEIGFVPATGSPLAGIDNVADAIEAAAALGGSPSVALADLTDVVLSTEVPPIGTLLVADGDGGWETTDAPEVDELMQFDGFNWNFITFADLISGLTFADIGGSPSLVQLRNQTVTALGTTGAVSLDPALGNMFTITPTGDVTLNVATATDGAEIEIFVLTSGTTSRNITFNTNFKSTGVLATGTVSGKNFVAKFKARAGFFYEISRTAAF